MRGVNLGDDERRQLVLVTVFVLVPFAFLAVWARFWPAAAWEPELLIALAADAGTTGQLSAAINFVGNLAPWLVVVVAAALLLGAARGVGAAILVLISAASDAAAFGVKVIVERARPETAAVEQVFGADNFAFPSGHTVRATALVAVTVWLLAPARWRVPLAVVAGLIAGAVMGYARISLGVHWPTDTLGGTLLGLGWFGLTTLLLARVVQPAQELDRAQG